MKTLKRIVSVCSAVVIMSSMVINASAFGKTGWKNATNGAYSTWAYCQLMGAAGMTGNNGETTLGGTSRVEVYNRKSRNTSYSISGTLIINTHISGYGNIHKEAYNASSISSSLSASTNYSNPTITSNYSCNMSGYYPNIAYTLSDTLY